MRMSRPVVLHSILQPCRAGLSLAGRPSPGFPVELGGFGELQASFFMERRTRGSVQ